MNGDFESVAADFEDYKKMTPISWKYDIFDKQPMETILVRSGCPTWGSSVKAPSGKYYVVGHFITPQNIAGLYQNISLPNEFVDKPLQLSFTVSKRIDCCGADAITVWINGETLTTLPLSSSFQHKVLPVPALFAKKTIILKFSGVTYSNSLDFAFLLDDVRLDLSDEVPLGPRSTGIAVSKFDSTRDAYWKISSVPTGNAFHVHDTHAYIWTNPYPGCVPNSDYSRWISISPTTLNVPAGQYQFQTTFYLQKYSCVSLPVQFSVDDAVVLVEVFDGINTKRFESFSGSGAQGFTQFIASGFGETTTITFTVKNTGDATGLMVEFGSAFNTIAGCTGSSFPRFTNYIFYYPYDILQKLSLLDSRLIFALSNRLRRSHLLLQHPHHLLPPSPCFPLPIPQFYPQSS